MYSVDPPLVRFMVNFAHVFSLVGKVVGADRFELSPLPCKSGKAPCSLALKALFMGTFHVNYSRRGLALLINVFEAFDEILMHESRFNHGSVGEGDHSKRALMIVRNFPARAWNKSTPAESLCIWKVFQPFPLPGGVSERNRNGPPFDGKGVSVSGKV